MSMNHKVKQLHTGSEQEAVWWEIWVQTTLFSRSCQPRHHDCQQHDQRLHDQDVFHLPNAPPYLDAPPPPTHYDWVCFGRTHFNSAPFRGGWDVHDGIEAMAMVMMISKIKIKKQYIIIKISRSPLQRGCWRMLYWSIWWERLDKDWSWLRKIIDVHDNMTLK